MKAKLMAGETVSDMYVDIEDDSSTYYRISKNEGRDDYRLLMQANGVTEYFNIDINGDETTHMIRGTAEDPVSYTHLGAGVCICLYIIKKKREKKNYED